VDRICHESTGMRASDRSIRKHRIHDGESICPRDLAKGVIAGRKRDPEQRNFGRPVVRGLREAKKRIKEKEKK